MNKNETMTPRQRTMAVRALRDAADRLEAGEDVEMYRYCPDDGYDDVDNCPDLDLTAYLHDGEWHPDVEQVEWGIKVPVEALRLTDIVEVCPRHNGFDYWCHYAQCLVLGYEQPAATRRDCEDCKGEKDGD